MGKGEAGPQRLLANRWADRGPPLLPGIPASGALEAAPAHCRGDLVGVTRRLSCKPRRRPGVDVAWARLRGSRRRPIKPAPCPPGLQAGSLEITPTPSTNKFTAVLTVPSSSPGQPTHAGCGEPTAVAASSPPASSLPLPLHLVDTPKFTWAHGCLARDALGVAT